MKQKRSGLFHLFNSVGTFGISSMLTSGLSLALGTLSAQAGPIKHSVFHTGPVTSADVEKWAGNPTITQVIINMDIPVLSEFKLLSPLKNKNLIVEVGSYPASVEKAEWSDLAEKSGAELMVIPAPVPTEDNLKLLDELRFKKVTLVFPTYFQRTDAEKFSNYLSDNLTVIFHVSRYPMDSDIFHIEKLPPYITLGISTDYWPWDRHVELLNYMPQKKIISVRDYFPSIEHQAFIKQLKGDVRFQISTNYSPSDSSLFTAFGDHPLTWVLREWVPDESTLNAFVQSSSLKSGETRRIRIDQDYDLFEDQQKRLESLAIPVDWIKTD